MKLFYKATRILSQPGMLTRSFFNRDCGLPGRDAAQTCTWMPTFRTNVTLIFKIEYVYCNA